ncbi:MAG TPA: sulfotransferase family protein [Cyanothece sp. UBA12306]|nr:sulfotransferase family protein [Cyanothece sp. UBA12306]
MNPQNHSLRHLIRLYKNDLIDKYYQFRINGTKNPYRVLLKKDSYKVIFIMSHMRSGSSLLTHILTSNSLIKGYGESHIQYSSEADLKRLMFKIYCHSQEFKNIQDLSKLRMNHDYVIDKLLHDNKLINENILKLENFYVIFLIREPKRSLISMLDHKPHWNEKDAIQYYNNRLSTLVKYAQIINNKQRSIIITYDALMNQTNLVFNALQKFLKLPKGFSEKYQVSNTTGMRHVGDFKEKIRSGKIIRTPREIDISISAHLLEQETEKFNQIHQKMSQLCQTIS